MTVNSETATRFWQMENATMNKTQLLNVSLKTTITVSPPMKDQSELLTSMNKPREEDSSISLTANGELFATRPSPRLKPMLPVSKWVSKEVILCLDKANLEDPMFARVTLDKTSAVKTPNLSLERSKDARVMKFL